MQTEYKRYFFVIEADPEKRVTKMDVGLKGEDFEGNVWFTDLQIQDGERLTGHIPNTKEMHLRKRSGGAIIPKKHYNIIGRSTDTIVVPNQGSITTALDLTVYPQDTMPAGTVKLGLGYQTRIFEVGDQIGKGDTYELKGSQQLIAKNGVQTNNYKGNYLTIASGDTLFYYDFGAGKSSKILIELEEMEPGIGGKKL